MSCILIYIRGKLWQPPSNLLNTGNIVVIWMPFPLLMDTYYHNICTNLLLLSHSVMSDFLRLYGLQHTRLLCPSSSLRTCSNSHPLNQWCHATISSSVIPFSSLQTFPASGSFLMSRLFASGVQSIRAWASLSVPPMDIQDWFSLGLTGLTSL